MKVIFCYLVVEVDISLLLKSVNCYISVATVTLTPFANMTHCRSYSKSKQQAKQYCYVTTRIATQYFNKQVILNRFILLSSRSHGLTHILYLFEILFHFSQITEENIVGNNYVNQRISACSFSTAKMKGCVLLSTVSVDVGTDVLEATALREVGGKTVTGLQCTSNCGTASGQRQLLIGVLFSIFAGIFFSSIIFHYRYLVYLYL